MATGPIQFSSVQFGCSVVSDSATPWIAARQAIHYQLPELAQTYVHCVQPSHPLSSPSPLAFSLSQHQGLFQWVSSLDQAAKVLELQLQHQFFQWIFRTHYCMANKEEKDRSSDRFPLLGLQNHCRQSLQPWNQKTIASWQESNGKPRQLLKNRDITLRQGSI